jgi:CO dehydrogenase/acetyl-CoA synthase alpha subunit
MSASTDPVQATISRLNERGNITRADVQAVLDKIMQAKTAAFIRDAKQAGHTAKEIESLIEAQRAMLATWRRDTLAAMLDDGFGSTER